MKKLIVIKLSSANLTNSSGKINSEFISDVCRQIAELHRKGHRVVVITSGAIACDKNKRRSPNLRAAVGQGRIFSAYANFLSIYGLDAAQLLLTDEQLIGGNTDITKAVICEAFRENVICIINANDVIDSEEIEALKNCADNDRLMELVCYLINADVAIVGFMKTGVLDLENNVIREIRLSNLALTLTYAIGGSKLGHGKDGMKTKIEVLSRLAASGIKATLAPGREKNFILRSFAEEKNFGTKFLVD